MSSLIVEVCKVINVEKHPNADRLDLATVKGWTCIVGRDNYKVGELVIFCPPDCIIPENLIEEYKLEFLKKCGRVGTVKLRKCISQGLILNVPEGKNWKEGKEVSKELGITKYEPPIPQYAGLKNKVTLYKTFQKYKEGKISLHRCISKCIGIIKDRLKKKKNPNPLFNKYTDIENIKNYNTIFKDVDMVVITEKIHGCGKYSSRVWLSNGETEKLGYIVNQKLDLEILGFDNKGKIIPVKITNWYRNGTTENWIKIQFINNRGEKASLTFTPDHMFYDPNLQQYKPLKDFKIEEEILYITKAVKPNFLQEQVMIGKVLGDASLRTKSIEFAHKLDHKEYVDYTEEMLKNFKTKCNINRISGYGTKMYGFKTSASAYVEELFKGWIKNGKKEVPKNIQLSPISLAFWYMDDGSLSHTENQEDRINIATNGFCEKSIDNLLEALKKIGIIGIKYCSQGWRIRINKDQASIFFALITPYIPTCMQYKLPKKYRGFTPILSKIIDKKPHMIKNKIISMEYIKKKQMKFDIETKTHNYVVNGVVVHNSNFRAGTLKRYTDSLWGKFLSFFFGKYEFVYGSHNVQKTPMNIKMGFYGEDVYGKIAKKYKLKDIIPEDYILYGEIYGKSIQELEYGMDDIDVVFFDLKYKGKYVDYKEFSKFCIDRQLPIVPVLYLGRFYQKMLKTYTEGCSILTFRKNMNKEQIREGCVVKSYREQYTHSVGRKILKSISAEYLCNKNRTENH